MERNENKARRVLATVGDSNQDKNRTEQNKGKKKKRSNSGTRSRYDECTYVCTCAYVECGETRNSLKWECVYAVMQQIDKADREPQGKGENDVKREQVRYRMQ